MKRPDLSNLSPEQLAYVNYVEGCLNGSSELILALNTASRVFARDLNLLCDGDAYSWEAEGEEDKAISRLTLLSDDAKNKTFDRIMVLFDKFDKIKALSMHFKDSKESTEAKKTKLPPGGNIFEHKLSIIKNGNSKV